MIDMLEIEIQKLEFEPYLNNMDESKSVSAICIFTLLLSTRHYEFIPWYKAVVSLCLSFLPDHHNHKRYLSSLAWLMVLGTGSRTKHMNTHKGI